MKSDEVEENERSQSRPRLGEGTAGVRIVSQERGTECQTMRKKTKDTGRWE